MAKRLLKCYFCGEQFDANAIPFVQVNSRRYAHKSCAEKADPQAFEDAQKDKELFDYIKKLFNYETIPVAVIRQIDTYKKDYNYTSSGILQALIYYYEVKHGSIERSGGKIGIVPYVYDEAAKYYFSIKEAQKRNVAQIIDINIDEIHIPIPQGKIKKHQLFIFLDKGEV